MVKVIIPVASPPTDADPLTPKYVVPMVAVTPLLSILKLSVDPVYPKFATLIPGPLLRTTFVKTRLPLSKILPA